MRLHITGRLSPLRLTGEVEEVITLLNALSNS